MSEERQYGVVEDFTNAFLVSFLAVVFLTLGTLWVNIGFVPTLIIAWFSERALFFATFGRLES